MACLGAPDTRVRGTWSYGRALKLDLRGGRVVAVRLLRADWRSAKGGLRVGASRAAALRALPGATVIGGREAPGDAAPGERRAGRAARRTQPRATREHHAHARPRSRAMTRIAAVGRGAPGRRRLRRVDRRPARSPAPAAPAASAAQLRAAADRAVALVDDPRRFGLRLALAPARRDVRGRIDPRARTITLFVDPHDATHRIAHDLAHQLGHAYDLAHLTETDRAAYLRRRAGPGASVVAVRADADYGVGAGDFAETFALCHAASPEFRSRLAPQPADPCGMSRPTREPEPERG